MSTINRQSNKILRFRFFFFNDTATTEIYTLSLHDALPICPLCMTSPAPMPWSTRMCCPSTSRGPSCAPCRSEEHTSELQSPCNLVCRLLLEKKKNAIQKTTIPCINRQTIKLQH